jgi:hypothetical protein
VWFNVPGHFAAAFKVEALDCPVHGEGSSPRNTFRQGKPIAPRVLDHYDGFASNTRFAGWPGVRFAFLIAHLNWAFLAAALPDLVFFSTPPVVCLPLRW